MKVFKCRRFITYLTYLVPEGNHTILNRILFQCSIRTTVMFVFWSLFMSTGLFTLKQAGIIVLGTYILHGARYVRIVTDKDNTILVLRADKNANFFLLLY